jgi:SAM-dependent methyltransferase
VVRDLFRRRRRPVDVRALVDEHLGSGDPTGWFEPLYVGAGNDADAVPWAGSAPHPYVTDWLDDPVATPSGTRAVVVGCGLGDDAAELARRGYEVTAFDVAPTAVAWAKRRFADLDITWRVEDVLALPEDLLGVFDLVVEVRTVQSLPGVVRDAAMDAIGRLAAPRGVVVVVTLVATDTEIARAWDGPPWVQAPSELAVYRGSGLVRLALEHPEPDEQGAMEVRITWQRPDGQPPEESAIGGPGGLPIVS